MEPSASILAARTSTPKALAERTTLMKAIVAATALLIATLFSVTFANPYLWIEDTAVDYDDTDLEEAYLGLAMQDGHLVVTIDDQSFEGALPAVHFEVPDLDDREDFFGNEFNADASNISDIRWIGVNDDGPEAAYLVGYEASHASTRLADALEAYTRSFGAMGFDAQVEDTAVPAVKRVIFSRDDARLEGRFHGRGGDVAVILQKN